MGRSHVFDRNAVPCDLSGNPIIRPIIPPPRMLPTSETLPLTQTFTLIDQTVRIGHAYHPPQMLHARNIELNLPTFKITLKVKHWLLEDEGAPVWVIFFCILYFIYMSPIFVYDYYSTSVPTTFYRWSNMYTCFCVLSAFIAPVYILDYLKTNVGDVMPLSCRGLRYGICPLEIVYFCLIILLWFQIIIFSNYEFTLAIFMMCSSYIISILNLIVIVVLGNRIITTDNRGIKKNS